MSTVTRAIVGALAVVGLLIILTALNPLLLFWEFGDSYLLAQVLSRLLFGGVFLVTAKLIEQRAGHPA